MKDKLRELICRISEQEVSASGTCVVSKEQLAELLAILDAEGDGGAVGEMSVVRRYALAQHTEYASSDEATHPARSGVVSDEDVEAALKVWNDAPALGRDEDDAYAMRAALELDLQRRTP